MEYFNYFIKKMRTFTKITTHTLNLCIISLKSKE